MALKLEDHDSAIREYDAVLTAGGLSQKVGALVRSKWEEAMAARRSRIVSESKRRGDDCDGSTSPKRPRSSQASGLSPPQASAPPPPRVVVNRSPVMILWAACNAERMGFEWSEALSLAGAVASLFARAKGSSLGLLGQGDPTASAFPAAEGGFHVRLLGQAVPAERSANGIRGLVAPFEQAYDQAAVHLKSEQPEAVNRRLVSAFKEHLGAVLHLMRALAAAAGALLLANNNRLAYELYTHFRPNIPAGRLGWGAAGCLHLTGDPKSLEAVRLRLQDRCSGGDNEHVDCASHQYVRPVAAVPSLAITAAEDSSIAAGSQNTLVRDEASRTRILAAISAADGGVSRQRLESLLHDVPKHVTYDCLVALQLDGEIYERYGVLHFL